MTVDEKTAEALDVARQLARDGIPVFIAPPSDDPKDTSGFRLPRNWQDTKPDPAALDGWQEGWAVCMVTGHGLDLVDLDIYANAEAGNLLESNGGIPVRYGSAFTASGGAHIFVKSIGVASRNAVIPGVDVKSGTPDGRGRGFAFIAPTVKKSKVTGEPATYSWGIVPDVRAARAAAGDTSGQRLADLIAKARRRGQGPPPGANGNGAAPAQQATLEAFAGQVAARPWGSYDPETRRGDKAIRDTLAAGRNDGVMRLACSLRQQGGWSLEAALRHMYEHVWPLIDQGQGGHGFPAEEFEGIIEHAWRAYPDGAEENLRQAGQNQAVAGNAIELRPPASIELTDSYLVKHVARWVLNSPWTQAPRLRWARGLGWLLWTGLVWMSVDDSYVRNQVREFFAFWYAESVRIINAESLDATILAKMTGLLSRSRIQAVTDLAHGYHDDADPGSTACLAHGLLTLRCAYCSVILDPAAFDAHPDLLNTPGGVVDLRTGEVRPHDSGLLLTRITSGSYEKGFRHADWDKALEALDAPERAWFRQRVGQGITGHPPGDGIMVVLQGSGENGKTACTTDGPVRALGDYASMASHKLISAATGNRGEHSTEIADLRGKRLLIGEELAEGRSIDVTALKRIQDVGKITARYVHRDNITFDASHTLLVTTNYVPVISETDHGTWRRLALLRFPYTFRRSEQACTRPADRLADPALKYRIKRNEDRQHDAIVTWAVEGAMAWYRDGYADAPPTRRVRDDTRAWRTESDLILGFWDEKLEPDPGSCIQSDEMREQFLAWQTGNGHKAWSKETFGQRFAHHEETTRHGVESRRVKAPRGLVRWPVFGGIQRNFGGSAQLTVWLGVRPKSQAGGGPGGQVAEVAEPPVNLSSDSSHRSFTQSTATPATKLNFPEQVAEVAQPPAGNEPVPSVTVLDHAPESPESPLGQESPPEPESQPVTEPKAKRKAKEAPPRPDPALEGPVIPLPAIVARGPDGPPVVRSCSLEDAAALAGAYLGALCVDCETTGYPPGHPDYALRLVQLGGEQVAAVFDPDDPAHQPVITGLVSRAAALHAHSAAADLVPLAHAGLGDADAMWSKMTDSVLIAKLADPAQAKSDENALKKLAKDLLRDHAVSPAAEQAKNELFKSGRWLMQTEALTPRERSGWAMVRKDCETFTRYAGSDVLDLGGVIRVLPRPDERILARERRFQAMCARISHQGFRLDPEHITAKIAEFTAKRDEARERVHAACPDITNPSSTKEVPAALAKLGVPLERTGEGNLSAAKEVLEPLANIPGYEHAPLLKDILEYRHDVTTLGLLLEPLNVLCERGDGRMRPVVYTINADTGRTSCVRPNGQQFSRQGGIRACVVADPGMLGISADFSGVEIRVAAALSGDRQLLEAELSTRCQACGNDPCDRAACGKDQKGLHWMAARMVFGENATKENRYQCKRMIFSKLFGGGPESGAKQVGAPAQAGHDVHRAFEQIAPAYAEWDQRMRAYVRAGNRGFVAYSGRTIWLPPARRPHAAGNYAIQGTARELLVDGSLAWEGTPWGRLPLLPIHDELLTMFIPGGEVREALEALKACMWNQRFYEMFGVPIEAASDEPFRAWPDSS